eukprot:CAMPEP_0117555826 /NCGR_PEP_ID=MMETSP0784-20121206/51480_1 /TAXON_ID=39447 /ORGANISM="" /LENGTH=128 /DNA_ID=CAMNT_0005353055 /DNA_START=67 /DNA_END=450 /DNA_ORIENTATION=+
MDRKPFMAAPSQPLRGYSATTAVALKPPLSAKSVLPSSTTPAEATNEVPEVYDEGCEIALRNKSPGPHPTSSSSLPGDTCGGNSASASPGVISICWQHGAGAPLLSCGHAVMPPTAPDGPGHNNTFRL